MDIEGKIILDLGQTEGTSKAGNPWKKHEWVLETMSQYPRKIKFTVFGDRVNTISFELNRNYLIQADIESREFNGRWYTDVTVFNARPMEDGMGGMSVQGPSVSGNMNPFPPVGNNAPGMSENNPYSTKQPDFTQGDSQEDLPF